MESVCFGRKNKNYNHTWCCRKKWNPKSHRQLYCMDRLEQPNCGFIVVFYSRQLDIKLLKDNTLKQHAWSVDMEFGYGNSSSENGQKATRSTTQGHQKPPKWLHRCSSRKQMDRMPNPRRQQTRFQQRRWNTSRQCWTHQRHCHGPAGTLTAMPCYGHKTRRQFRRHMIFGYSAWSCDWALHAWAAVGWSNAIVIKPLGPTWDRQRLTCSSCAPHDVAKFSNIAMWIKNR